MPRYPFLSDEWIVEARAIREDLRRAQGPVVSPVRANLVVIDVPFGSGTIDAHLDTSTGSVELETGHLEAPDATITLEYPTARAMFVEGDAQVLMQAFMGGRIRIDGDLAKLLALQTALPQSPALAEAASTAEAAEHAARAASRLRDITA